MDVWMSAHIAASIPCLFIIFPAGFFLPPFIFVFSENISFLKNIIFLFPEFKNLVFNPRRLFPPPKLEDASFSSLKWASTQTRRPWYFYIVFLNYSCFWPLSPCRRPKCISGPSTLASLPSMRISLGTTMHGGVHTQILFFFLRMKIETFLIITWGFFIFFPPVIM